MTTSPVVIAVISPVRHAAGGWQRRAVPGGVGAGVYPISDLGSIHPIPILSPGPPNGLFCFREFAVHSPAYAFVFSFPRQLYHSLNTASTDITMMTGSYNMELSLSMSERMQMLGGKPGWWCR
ncbi:uncharacterized protein BP01DRAFT_358466 [Aspergillus saccharolyticus JOP 1030-1]|uniref:Uncharacterized protein n=1 Tax=Aspergillus saccharolyticus JOP 1030-1 TaxID=1450539 RepID=A0A318ZAW5_9EURO|nr:hypothetical protein BP01DRAFT_358466 [Aspergillus saccharolyticus JOP 1030-1]PYH43474.1 hypothetical protein BP01DRAFT_358466 [Aspergillus saccharolyticus JOP 1030-1]